MSERTIAELEQWLADLDGRIEQIQTKLNHLHRYRNSMCEEIRLRRDLERLETQLTVHRSTTGWTAGTGGAPVT